VLHMGALAASAVSSVAARTTQLAHTIGFATNASSYSSRSLHRARIAGRTPVFSAGAWAGLAHAQNTQPVPKCAAVALAPPRREVGTIGLRWGDGSTIGGLLFW
jgi:hypothetical protein